MSGFTVSNGNIYDQNGNAFVARGVDVMNWNTDSNPSAATLQTDFPGINFVRLAIYNYDSPDSLASYVNDLTSHGIVVELENHASSDGQNRGGSTGTIFTGQTLTTEQNWYASVAAAFKGNPAVWFGTNNEPSETDPNTGQTNAAMLSDWQKTTYDTIRNAGNSAPIMLESTSWGVGGTNVGYNASDYSGMTNVVWDQHYYGWLPGYSTDQATVTNTLNGIVSDLSAIKSADGTMPVIVGEYGNSTTGQSIDANGDQVVSAVLNSGLGNVAWAWGSGNPGDGLTDGGNGLSSYGQQVAAGIAAQAAQTPSLPPPVTTPNAPASATGTIVLAGSTGVITDAAGHQWTVANGTVQMDGAAAGYSANVGEIAYVNGTVWQENAAGQWWGWSNGGWNTGNGTTTNPLPAPAPAPTPTPAPPAITPSANDTVVTAGTTDAITDAAGHQWTVANGTVQMDGAAAGYSSGVTELAYVDGTVWQENQAGDWWGWSNGGWNTGNGTTTSPLPVSQPAVTPDTVIVSANGVSQPVTGSGTFSGDTFKLETDGVTKIDLGSTPTFVQALGNAGISVTGGSATAVVMASDGANSFTAGTGYMDVTGGAGADAYTFGASSKFLSVDDFSVAKGDTLSVASGLQSGMQAIEDGHNTLLAFGNGAAIELRGVTTTPTIHWN